MRLILKCLPFFFIFLQAVLFQTVSRSLGRHGDLRFVWYRPISWGSEGIKNDLLWWMKSSFRRTISEKERVWLESEESAWIIWWYLLCEDCLFRLTGSKSVYSTWGSNSSTHSLITIRRRSDTVELSEMIRTTKHWPISNPDDGMKLPAWKISTMEPCKIPFTLCNDPERLARSWIWEIEVVFRGRTMKRQRGKLVSVE